MSGSETRHERPSQTTGTPFKLERDDAADSLRAAVEAAGRTGGALVIRGEPDVGKSALTVRVVDELRSADAVVLALSLGDLPGTALDLEHPFGGVSLSDLFGGAATGAIRLLVVDGCEAILEGKEAVFVALATAAFRAGFAVAAVTRVDGSRYVRDVVRRALGSSSVSGSVAGLDDQSGRQRSDVLEHVVDELSTSERAQLVEAVEGLARLQADPRAAWLLGRPGLVDALMRSGDSWNPVNSCVRPTCTWLCGMAGSDVVALSRQVRPEPMTVPAPVPSPSPAVGSVVLAARTARRLGEPRSDGVLRAESNPAFAVGPEFATDLYRDFGLCRLFLESGWQPLKDAAVAAVADRSSFGCPARLLSLSVAGAGGSLRRVARAAVEFRQSAAMDAGARWLEVPYEALLTLGDARVAFGVLWDALDADDGLATLLRLADARYAKARSGTVRFGARRRGRVL